MADADARTAVEISDIDYAACESPRVEQGDEPVTECPICLSTPAEAPAKTRCGHVFCAGCLVRAFPRETLVTGTCPLCRAQVSLYSTLDVSTGRPLRVPDVSTPVGCVFVQQGDPGVASYHFEAAAEGGGLGEAYISYESCPATWKLDDGSSPPARKPFTDARYDPASRTFTGTVTWAAPATFHGAARWEYEMVFSESFNVIQSGRLRAFDAAGSPLHQRRFPRDLIYWRQGATVASIVGQAYVQGERLGMASYHFEAAAEGGGLGEAYISYDGCPDTWTLDDGSRPPARKPFADARYDPATRTFTGTITWEPAFHGDGRWEYEMVFSENFESIESGEVRSFRVDGNAGAPHRFGRNPMRCLVYSRLAVPRAEMVALLKARAANNWLAGAADDDDDDLADGGDEQP